MEIQKKIKGLSTATDPRSRAIFDNLELQLALYLWFEPTIADLIARPMSISNATLHEFILMRLKEVTLVFTKTLEKNTRKETTRLENELTKLIDSDSRDSAEKIRLIEHEILQKEQEFLEQELKFKENFTLLEDERATKNFLNLESTKGGYNEITTLILWQ